MIKFVVQVSSHLSQKSYKLSTRTIRGVLKKNLIRNMFHLRKKRAAKVEDKHLEDFFKALRTL